MDLVTGSFGTIYPVQDGNQSVDLNSAVTGGIQQTISTTAGQSYQLSFWLSGFPAAFALCPAADPKTLTVNAGTSSQSFSFTPNSSAQPSGNQQFVQETMTFDGASGTSSTLDFLSTTFGCAGPIIDDITVVPTGS